ncbi:hypothetical protein [Congregibacter litoralis]|uniref:Uncharacterized protein n=1 Tax=Congregibacter litoralis KT71 TaxID=314285 RepID=A4A4R5_9GAMM|nr:hypothetical protein [Congregibacter litoralis]EAQ98786.1 hypothetical protein KT71_09172 [Congregibacter litoralis KT71]
MDNVQAQLVYEDARRKESALQEFESLRPTYNPIVSAVAQVMCIALFMWFINSQGVGSSSDNNIVFMAMFMLILGNQYFTLELHRRTHTRIDAFHRLMSRSIKERA